jgi:antitoxin (DNA-binding transcriptional repressor) of toxin-antitoxin stability system
MAEITMRELRTSGAEVIDRVTRGESLTVTRDGEPIAEFRPLPRRPLSAAVLLLRWRGVPAIDGARLRADINALVHLSL